MSTAIAWSLSASATNDRTVKTPEEFIPTRQSLLSRLKDWNDHDSWKVFFDTYWKLIYSTAIKAGLRDSEAQDVVQETIISISKVMPEFQYDPRLGTFKAWLLQLTRWRIADQMRKRLRAVHLDQSEESSNLTQDDHPLAVINGDLEAIWQEEWERNLVDAAIQRVKQRVDAKYYQIFDYHVLQRWPVAKVMATLGVSASRIYLVKHRIGRLIKKEVRRLETKMI